MVTSGSKSIFKGDIGENIYIMAIVAKVLTFVKFSGENNGIQRNN